MRIFFRKKIICSVGVKADKKWQCAITTRTIFILRVMFSKGTNPGVAVDRLDFNGVLTNSYKHVIEMAMIKSQ